MRFHTTLEAAEGQHYDALQQGVPQQPKVPLLLHLPHHDMLAARRRVLSVEHPRLGKAFWHCCSADAGRVKVPFISAFQMLNVQQ